MKVIIHDEEDSCDGHKECSRCFNDIEVGQKYLFKEARYDDYNICIGCLTIEETIAIAKAMFKASNVLNGKEILG